jgi:hypothetical protein
MRIELFTFVLVARDSNQLGKLAASYVIPLKLSYLNERKRDINRDSEDRADQQIRRPQIEKKNIF